MPIDLLNLISTLNSVIKFLEEKYDDYNRLQDNKQESLDKFWRTVSRLTDDMRTYWKFTETLHGHPAWPSFITPANLADWNDFLDHIESTFCRFQHHELSGSAPSTKQVAKTIIASLIFVDVLTISIKQIDAKTASLVSDMEAIERAYKRLYASFILHSISRRPGIPLWIPVTIPSVIDTIVSSFHRNIFLSTTTVSADTLCRLNENRDVAEHVTEVMKKEAVSFTENFIRSDSIDEFSRVQKFTMELLWAACIPHLESEELQFARLGDERVSNATLKELSFGLKSAIARAKNQSFSIAFCGMVKAG
jgi:hypothetical protein